MPPAEQRATRVAGGRVWRSVLGVLVAVAAVFAPRLAEACTCRGPVPACQATWEHAAVFVARVQQFVHTTDRDVVDFDVIEAFRGAEPGPLQMSIPYGTCSYRFEQGRTYLIYAESSGTGLSTGVCSGDRPVEQAGEDLAYLRSLAGMGRPPLGQVRGTAAVIGPNGERTVLPGLRITVTGSGTTHDVRTDPDGRFSLRLPVDTYVVHAQVPAELVLIPSGMSTQLRDTRGCAVADVFLQRSP